MPLRGEVRLLILDVPRESIPEIERNLTALGRQHSVEVLGAVGLEAAGTQLTTFALGADREDPELDGAIWALLDTSGSDGGRMGPTNPDDADYSGSTLFGFENRAATVRDELLEIARGLPRSHAAVMLIVRPRWRVALAQVLDATESDIVVERGIDVFGANRDSGADDVVAFDGDRRE